MRRALFFVCLCVAVLRPAFAQAPVATPPYVVLTAVTPPSADAGAVETFAAIRAVLAAKDEARLARFLSRDFAAMACSSDPTQRCAPRAVAGADRKRAPLERLRLALCCGGKDDPTISPSARTEAMFGVLASLLEGGTPGTSPDFSGAVCDPAVPAIDRAKTAALAKALDIDATVLRLAGAPIEARGRAERTVAVVATLPKGAIVPLLTTSATPTPAGWIALALPDGGIGYAEGAALDELAPESLCLRKEKDGWKMALLIGRQS